MLTLNKKKPAVLGEPCTLEDVKTFYNWLQGEPLENFVLSYQPKLSPEEAFSIIYVLQEGLGIIPDTIEMCKECNQLYDSNSEGRTIDDDSESSDGNPYDEEMYGNYCDNCEPMW